MGPGSSEPTGRSACNFVRLQIPIRKLSAQLVAVGEGEKGLGDVQA